MNAKLGWALAVLAVALGYAFWGWRGVAVAGSGAVFWLLLQASQVMRAMRAASARPVGTVASAVMLHARLGKGLRLLDVIQITRSLGQRQPGEPETWRWRDASGASVTVVLQAGRVRDWTLGRPASDNPPPAGGPSATDPSNPPATTPGA